MVLEVESLQRDTTTFKTISLRQKLRRKAHDANLKIPIPDGQLCEACKIRPAVLRHHPNYNKPYLVAFLCQGCHRDVHLKPKNYFQCRYFSDFWKLGETTN